MIARRDRRSFMMGGMAAFTAVLLFIGLAVAALLTLGGQATSDALFDTYTLRILRFTLWQATLSTLFSVLLGLPVALALARQREFPGRAAMLLLSL